MLAAHDAHASFFIVADATEHNETLWADRVAYALANALRAERSETMVSHALGVDTHMRTTSCMPACRASSS